MNATANLQRLLERLFLVLEMPIRYIFGRDIFISYSRADSGKYAPNLALALQANSPSISTNGLLHLITNYRAPSSDISDGAASSFWSAPRMLSNQTSSATRFDRLQGLGERSSQ